MSTIFNFPAVTQGETWDPELELLDSAGAAVDLTGCSARLTIRETKGLAGAILTAGDLTSSDGLTLGGALGTITILRTAAQTALWPARRCYYELKITYTSGATRSEFDGILPINGASSAAP